jgi:hypothetical protein
MILDCGFNEFKCIGFLKESAIHNLQSEQSEIDYYGPCRLKTIQDTQVFPSDISS